MRRNAITLLALFSLIMVVMLSCEKENETKISKYNSDDSHNVGLNCMTCHTQGGEGHGVFEVAGTVYESNRTTTYPNATVRLYSGPSGTGDLKYTIQVDALGNFYTTEGINFGSGLYASVEGNQQTHHMQSSITTGACNSCHGGQTGKIWTE
jgi:cytochrome c553